MILIGKHNQAYPLIVLMFSNKQIDKIFCIWKEKHTRWFGKKQLHTYSWLVSPAKNKKIRVLLGRGSWLKGVRISLVPTLARVCFRNCIRFNRPLPVGYVTLCVGVLMESAWELEWSMLVLTANSWNLNFSFFV